MRKMGNKLVFFAVVLTLGVICASRVTFASTGDSPWPVFGHDARHTSLSPYELSRDKKEVLWSYKAGSSIESSPVIGEDGTIYVGSHDGFFYAFNPDGSVKWKLGLSSPVYDPRWNVSKAIMASPAIARDGTVYINTASGYLHAVNPDGSEKWRFAIRWHSDFWNGPNIGADGTIYIGTARSEGVNKEAGLYAINLDGTKKWFVMEDSGITVVPAIAGDGTIIYGAANPQDNRGRIKALTPEGNFKWEFVLEEWLEGPPAIDADGTVYTGSKEGNAFALSPSGQEKWRFKTSGGISAMPTIGADDTVYFGSWDGNFYALDKRTGREKWHFDVKVGKDPKLFEGYPGKEAIVTTAAISKDGIIVFADIFDTVYAVDTSGQEVSRWKSPNGNGFASSPAIAKDGTIYIGDEGGYFYALGKKESGMAEVQMQMPNRQTAATAGTVIVSCLLVLAGVICIIYWEREKGVEGDGLKFNQFNHRILVIGVLAILVAGGIMGSVFLIRNWPNRAGEKTSAENIQTEQANKTNGDIDDFTRNSIRVSEEADVWIREFGEVGRHCTGKDCGNLKDTCIRWDKNRDTCYEMVKTSPATSDRYKIYCNLVVVNQDREKEAGVSLNLTYITADGMKHLVQNESFVLESGNGQSLGWTYDVSANDIGKCSYSDIVVTAGGD